MKEEQSARTQAVSWKWIGVGTVIGLAIVSLSYFILEPTFKSHAILFLVMLMGFVITGIVVGYFSPGVTLKESAVAGLFVAVLIIGLLFSLNKEALHNTTEQVLALIGGVILTLVGGWVGEKLQGSIEEEHPSGGRLFADLQWRWVAVGVILGFALNIVAVFLTAPLFTISLTWAFVMFCLSTFVTGFIVGFKSPGIALKEASLAGAIVVLLEWLFVEFSMELTVAGSTLAFGLVIGFLLTYLGAWVGEEIQARVQQTA